MSGPLYTREILRLAAEIPHLVGFEALGEARELRSPNCGSRACVAVAVDEAGRVVSLRQAVEACAFGQASAALMGARVIGRSQDEVEAAVAAIEVWLAGGSEDEPWPGFAALEPIRRRKGRHGAVLLPFRALLVAIKAER